MEYEYGDEDIRACFGTKECACKSIICKRCKDKVECRKYYKDKTTRFKPEMEIK